MYTDEVVTLTEEQVTLRAKYGQAQTYEWVTNSTLFTAEDAFELLPPFVRWHSRLKDRWLLEFPPGHRNVTVNCDTQALGTRVARVPMPWTVYFVNLATNKLYIYARTQQLRSVTDKLCWYHMSNVMRNHEQCAGYAEMKINPGATRLDQALRKVNEFWNTTFNGGFYVLGHGGKAAPKQLKKKAHPRHGGIDDGVVWPKSDIWDWLEEVSIEDLLSWDWQEDHTLEEAFVANFGAVGSSTLCSEIAALVRANAAPHQVVT